jgi:hypothetical protein
MPSTAFAPATTGNRVIVGPASTTFGFKCWYLVCFQDAIVAVPQSFLTAAAMAYSTDSRRVSYSAKAQLVMDLLTSPGRRLRAQIPARLQTVPDSQLRSRPSVVILTSQVRSIVLKSSKMARYGTVVTPEINLEMNTGKKLVYGIYAWDFEKVCGQLWQMYPQLCK